MDGVKVDAMTSTRKQKKHPEAADRTAEDKRGEARRKTEHDGHEGGLHMHTLHAKVPIPYLTPGDLMADAKAAKDATAKLARPASRPGMPPPRQLAFYGGLGALVVTGLVDLPVAVAIGAATVVARGRGERRREQEEREQAERERQAAAPAPAGQTA